MRQWWKTVRAPVQPRSAERLDPTCDRPVDDDPAPFRGWYESSWELERGLAVVEAGELELAVWELVSGEPASYFSGPV